MSEIEAFSKSKLLEQNTVENASSGDLDFVAEEEPKSWKFYHTVTGIWIRLWGDGACKNLNVFYLNYASALNISSSSFSYIMMANLLGWVLAIFFSDFNTKVFKTSKKIGIVYVLCAGLLCFIFVFPTLINENFSTKDVVIYCGLTWLLFGISFSSFKVSVVHVAQSFLGTNKKGKVISYLGLSWGFASLLYIPIGYLIEYTQWYYSFLLFSIVNVLNSFIYYKVLPTPPESARRSIVGARARVHNSVNNKNTGTSNKKRQCVKIFGSLIINCILISHLFSGLACGSIETSISGPWLQDVYNFSASKTGYISLIIFVAEMLGSIFCINYSDKYNCFVLSLVAYSMFLIPVIGICVLTNIFGIFNVGIYLPFITNFVYFCGWKIFWAVGQIAIVKLSPKTLHKHKRTILQANLSFTAFGRIIGLLLSAHLWDDGHGLILLSYIWIASICISSFCWVILYCKVKNLK